MFLVGSVKRFSSNVRFGRSKSSKVIDFGSNRKRVCDFLLVRHSNLGPILQRFGDIAGFCAHDITITPSAAHDSSFFVVNFTANV